MRRSKRHADFLETRALAIIQLEQRNLIGCNSQFGLQNQTRNANNWIQINMMKEQQQSVKAPSPSPPSEKDSQQPSSLQIDFLSDQHTFLISRLLAENKPVFEVFSPQRCTIEEQISKEKVKHKILTYNRKEKSLEELCKKFIDNFEGRNGTILELDKVTVQLNVERRRIYDIINILESLDVVKKKGKNNYLWRGLREAITTIQLISEKGKDHVPFTNKKEKSLQHLAYTFLKLFINQDSPLSLDEAARVLISTCDYSMIKTKIRRLYDIVNVFRSLGLIKKTHVPSKKPGFIWLGTAQLLQIIQEKKTGLKLDEASAQSLEKQNTGSLQNTCFSKQLAFGEMKGSFSAKTFLPCLIQTKSSAFTLVGSQDSMISLFAQY